MKRILEPGRNVWCEADVEHCSILIDGDNYYRALFEAGQLAQNYILLAGWQFDTDACLLRGHEAQSAKLPVTLLAYLDALCAQNPALRIQILAWDFHAVFALEREWMQDLRFKWLTSERLQFIFDANHVEGGAHHQKFAVLDGELAFLGGLDLCDHRWDDRRHIIPNPLRVSRGAPHQPFHDVQACLRGGQAPRKLAQLFEARWRAAGGAPLELPAPTGCFSSYEPPGATRLLASRVALSRVDPYGNPDGKRDCCEIMQLFLDAIAASERLIYVETQYFSSQIVGDALAARLRSSQGPPLEVVLVLNRQAETFKEEVAVGLAQAKVIQQLREAAAGTAHKLGIYYTIPETEDGNEPERATYIHSKLMIVDDRFLSVGSANLTNRSQRVDTELNVSLETLDPGDEIARSIAQARLSLLTEHLGVEDVGTTGALVEELDARAERHEGRLRLHPSPTEAELTALQVVDPAQLPFDPAAPEAQSSDQSLFAGGLGALWTRLFGDETHQ